MPEMQHEPDARDVAQLERLRATMSDFLAHDQPVPEAITKKIIHLMEKTGIAEEMVADEFLPDEPQPRWSDASIRAAAEE